MKLFLCVLYCAAIGILSNPIAALLPRSWFDPEKAPYASFSWEQDGRIYNRLGIRLWQDHVPDMSKILKNMVRKEVASRPTCQSMDTLARETCISEAVHWALILLSPPLLLIWPGIGGWICTALWIAGNLPFILIQRYNRPRLVHTRNRLRKTQCIPETV